MKPENDEESIPVALTIAGSDSGGGAGIQADLRTFTAFGVHGVCVLTCVTAQNPSGVRAVQACSRTLVQKQLEAIWEELSPQAAKTGMLWNEGIVETVAAFWKGLGQDRPPLVVDPVMVATSGATLARQPAVKAMIRQLLPLATVLTPNLDEVEVLLGWRPKKPEQLSQAARELNARFGSAVVIKGGHLETQGQSLDFFFDGRHELLLTAPRIHGVQTHGTGCAFSAAIAARLAQGLRVVEAVQWAKRWVTQAIMKSVRVGKAQALGLFGPVEQHEKNNMLHPFKK